jgi:hypothetical protein
MRVDTHEARATIPLRPVLWAADHPRRARTYARTQGIAVLRDEGHASLEWKAGIVGQRTHLTEGFGQLQGGLASAWCSHRAARRSGRGRWGAASGGVGGTLRCREAPRSAQDPAVERPRIPFRSRVVVVDLRDGVQQGGFEPQWASPSRLDPSHHLVSLDAWAIFVGPAAVRAPGDR